MRTTISIVEEQYGKREHEARSQIVDPLRRLPQFSASERLPCRGLAAFDHHHERRLLDDPSALFHVSIGQSPPSYAGESQDLAACSMKNPEYLVRSWPTQSSGRNMHTYQIG